ncbi:MAG: hypothetical protein KIS63_22000, partial [Caldilineales bacterium]|nr:hypothetical protein [Caldilineales bacterium]
AILLWNAIHHTIHHYQLAHPDWQFVRYEDLAAAPLPGFEALYAALGLAWSPGSMRAIREYSAVSNPAEANAGDALFRPRDSRSAALTWVQRLTPDEIRRLRKGAGEAAARFYADDDWAGAATVVE